MSVPIAVALFLTIWWIVLFAVLPFGITSQLDADEVVNGTEPGAPVAPRLVRKALWTTLIAAVVFGAVLLGFNILQ